MARIVDNKIIRRCTKCSTTSDIVKFKRRKDSRSGRIYEHNVCEPCFKEYQNLITRKLYLKNRKDRIEKSRRWNVENKERYNARRRKR